MKELTVLVAHGSSDPDWAATFSTLTEPARARFENARLAFMELSTPSIEDVVREAVVLGYQHVHVIPLFLAKGKHLKKDIPNILKELEDELDISTHLSPPIGEHPALAQALTRIIDEAIEGR